MTTRLIAWLDQWAGPFALEATIAGTLILVVALLVNRSLRRSAASLRHRVWTLAILGLLAYPLVHPILPKFSLGLRTASPNTLADVKPTPANLSEPRPLAHTTASPVQDRNLAAEMATRTGSSTDSFSVPQPPIRDSGDNRRHAADMATPAAAFHWPSILAAVWAMGAVIGLGFLVIVHLAAYRLVGTAASPSDPSWRELAAVLAAQLGVRRRVAVRVSDRIAVPVTAGWLHPAILLPSDCEQWLAPRRRMVLIHEMSHVARGDVLWQIGAKLACVIYWPHPLVWLAARRMRVEREAACDDAVVRDVERPSAYASLLLDVAASLASHPTGMGTAVAMACGRSVEERIRWIVQPGRCRLPIGRRTARWLSAGAILIVLGLGSISLFAGPPAPAAPAASASAAHTEKTPAKAGNRGHIPEAEKTFEPFATLECSGVSGGIGGILYSTGFTFVKSSEPNAKKTRLIVSFASDQPDDDIANYRVVAISKDGRTFTNESSESSSGRGRRTGVTTIICEFPVPDNKLEKLRIERLKDAKSTGQSKGQSVSQADARGQNGGRFHLVRGNTTWIGTDNAPLQYDDYDKLCFWLWDPHTVVLPRPSEGFFDFYKERTLRPGVGRMDVSRAEWPAGQPANITMPGEIDLPTYQLLLQPSVQRALNLSKEQRTKLQDISTKYWSERRQIAGKALDDMEATAQKKMAAENAKAGHKGSEGFVNSSSAEGTSPFSNEVVEKLERQWGSARKQIEDVLTSEQLRTLNDLTFRTFAFGSGAMFAPEALDRLGVTKDQQAKLQALELELQKEKGRRLRSTTAERMKKILAVLTPQQLSQLRKKHSPDKSLDCSNYPYPGLPSHMPDTGAADELGLSAEQQARVRKIVAAHWRSLIALQHEEQKVTVGDEKGRQAISDKRRQERANLRKQIEAALTPEQWRRFNEIAFENLAVPYLRIMVQRLQASSEMGVTQRLALAVYFTFEMGLTSQQMATLREIDAAYFDKPEQIYRELTDKALTAFTPAQQERLRIEVDRRGW